MSSEIVLFILILIIFWFHVGHVLSSKILLVLLLNVLYVILNFRHWLLHRSLSIHVWLDHSVYLLLLLISKNATCSLILSHHSIVLILRNSHLLHRSPLRTGNFACLLAPTVLVKLIPQREQHPLDCFGYHFHTVLDILGRCLQCNLRKDFVIKCRPIIRLLLHWMCVWVIMQVYQLRLEVLHHFSY